MKCPPVARPNRRKPRIPVERGVREDYLQALLATRPSLQFERPLLARRAAALLYDLDSKKYQHNAGAVSRFQLPNILARDSFSM